MKLYNNSNKVLSASRKQMDELFQKSSYIVAESYVRA